MFGSNTDYFGHLVETTNFNTIAENKTELYDILVNYEVLK